MSKLFNKRKLDRVFPTVVRYLGVVILIYAAFIDRGKNPALIPAAMGMIFLKTVYGGEGGD